MNLLSNIKVDKNHNLTEPRLTMISAMAGHGKTLLVRTMIMNYLKSGINVILFCETNEECTFDNIQKLKLENQQLGQLIVFNMTFADDIRDFNSLISKELEFMINSCVIIIDRPMFMYNQNSFIYTKIKNENTRFVIFEKHNFAKKLAYQINKTLNRNVQQKHIASALRQLCILFNTHVIVTNQQYNRPINLDGIIDVTNHALMHISDAFFSVRRNNNDNFTITCVKDRHSDMNREIKCKLNKNTLTLETILN